MSPASLSPDRQAGRAGSLVDVTARLALVVAVISVVYSAIQLGVIGLLRRAGAAQWLAAHNLPLPAGLDWLLRHAGTLGVLMLLASLALLAVGWGLLARREWARTGFIGFLLLTAVANFACLPLIQALFNGLAGMFPAGMLQTPQGQELLLQLQVSRWICLITGAATALAFALLHGWLALKLGKPDVRVQFH
ncbi:hypothetical protein [Stenotrophomonas sp. YIM B06876]|uniref:hypothetical protein n=1 Tax=Stenotrophomonas sp. YIM B06876 TaxID=3060211 RepID=UPI0027387327|nr:hypothetical protein [Stenotrophomonas sp. YIM B06876]